MAKVWSESEKLLSSLAGDKPLSQYQKNKLQREPLVDTATVQYRLEEKAFIENAVMMIPVDAKTQIHLHIYNIEGKRFLDIREYSLRRSQKFMSTSQGLRIPIEYLEQLIIRLKVLNKDNTWELKL